MPIPGIPEAVVNGNASMYESSARYPMPAGIVNGYSAPVTPAPNGLPSTNAFASAYHDAASAYNDKAYDPAPGPARQIPNGGHANGGSVPNGKSYPNKGMGTHAPPELTRVCLYEHEGEGVVYCEGPPPPFAVYERDDGIKLVVSTFNLTCEIDENPAGFTMRLAPDHSKQSKASLFRSPFGETRHGQTLPADLTKLEVVLGPTFNLQAIEVAETKTRLKVMLPKKEAVPRIGLKMHRARGD